MPEASAIDASTHVTIGSNLNPDSGGVGRTARLIFWANISTFLFPLGCLYLMTQENQVSKNNSVETLRAVAVLMVFANHLHSLGIVTVPYFGISGGWLGVQIFFVISGYLIIQSAMRYSLWVYAKHRMLRIYPAYLFWFVVFSLVFGDFAVSALDVKSLLAHLFFLQHFFPGAYMKYDALRVTWTLTVEAVWYVLAFLIAAKFYRAPSKYTVFFVLLACVWVTGGVGLRIFSEIQDPGQRYFFIQNSAIAQMPFFLFGAWISVKQPRFDKAALLALIVSTVALFKSWEPIAVTPIFITGFGVSALFLILRDSNYKNPKSIRLLSDISYSFYLVHYPIIVLVMGFVHNKYHRVFLAFAVTVIVSYVSYLLIEKPFMKMAKNRAMTAPA